MAGLAAGSTRLRMTQRRHATAIFSIVGAAIDPPQTQVSAIQLNNLERVGQGHPGAIQRLESDVNQIINEGTQP
jgi:hypothetical protein